MHLPADAIRQLHWGRVGSGTLVLGLESCPTVLAIWPAPVDADRCFAEAGYNDFEDSGEGWDCDWQAVVSRTLKQLEVFGPPHLCAEAVAYDRGDAGLLRRMLASFVPQPLPQRKIALPVVEQIQLVTRDDRFQDVVIAWGDPVNAWLRAGQGHAILWVGWCLPVDQPEEFVAAVAGGLPAVETGLNWDRLAPIGRR